MIEWSVCTSILTSAFIVLSKLPYFSVLVHLNGNTHFFNITIYLTYIRFTVKITSFLFTYIWPRMLFHRHHFLFILDYIPLTRNLNHLSFSGNSILYFNLSLKCLLSNFVEMFKIYDFIQVLLSIMIPGI